MVKKSNAVRENYIKLIWRKYHLYTSNQKTKYLSIYVTLNVSIMQPNLTRMHFIRATKCTGAASYIIIYNFIIGDYERFSKYLLACL